MWHQGVCWQKSETHVIIVPEGKRENEEVMLERECRELFKIAPSQKFD